MTHSPPRIFILGDSLLLAGLEASLAGAQVQTLKVSETFRVLGTETFRVLGTETLRVLDGAAVLVYDQAETDLGQLAAWLTGAPDAQTLKVSETFRVLDGLTLLGLDAEHDRIHVVTGHSQAVAAVGELTRVVLAAAGAWSG